MVQARAYIFLFVLWLGGQGSAQESPYDTASDGADLVTLLQTQLQIAPRESRPRNAEQVDAARVHNAVSKLWHGHDLSIEESDLIRRSAPSKRRVPLHRQSAEEVLQRGKHRRLKLVLMGPFDVGTHLLLETLKLNFPEKLPSACGFGSVYIEDRFNHCRVWKHAVNLTEKYYVGEEPLITVLKNRGEVLDQTVLVTMMRSPLAQIQAWTKSPYDLQPCTRQPALNRSCSLTGMTWTRDGDHDLSQSSVVRFPSTIDIYNSYLRMYLRLAQEKRLHRVVMVKYEDLVSAPEKVVATIADAMNWDTPLELSIVNGPAKIHGHAVGRDAALDSLIERKWCDEFTGDKRSQICRGLDAGELRGLRESTYTEAKGASRSYFHDCDGFV